LLFKFVLRIFYGTIVVENAELIPKTGRPWWALWYAPCGCFWQLAVGLQHRSVWCFRYQCINWSFSSYKYAQTTAIRLQMLCKTDSKVFILHDITSFAVSWLMRSRPGWDHQRIPLSMVDLMDIAHSFVICWDWRLNLLNLVARRSPAGWSRLRGQCRLKDEMTIFRAPSTTPITRILWRSWWRFVG